MVFFVFCFFLNHHHSQVDILERCGFSDFLLRYCCFIFLSCQIHQLFYFPYKHLHGSSMTGIEINNFLPYKERWQHTNNKHKPFHLKSFWFSRWFPTLVFINKNHLSWFISQSHLSSNQAKISYLDLIHKGVWWGHTQLLCSCSLEQAGCSPKISYICADVQRQTPNLFVHTGLFLFIFYLCVKHTELTYIYIFQSSCVKTACL